MRDFLILMFYQIFLSPQVRQIFIISNKRVLRYMVYGMIYTSCRTTLDLGSQKIMKYQQNFKISLTYSLLPILTHKMKNLSILPTTC